MKVDPSTLVCRPHGVHGCEVCMVDDFHAWLDERRRAGRAYREQWRATPVAERFDLGGEA